MTLFLIKGRFGVVTDELTGDTDAKVYFTFERRNTDPNVIDIYATNGISDDDALQYTVSIFNKCEVS